MSKWIKAAFKAPQFFEWGNTRLTLPNSGEELAAQLNAAVDQEETIRKLRMQIVELENLLHVFKFVKERELKQSWWEKLAKVGRCRRRK